MSKREEIDRIADECAAKSMNLTAKYMVEAARDADTYPELNKYLWQVDTETLAAEARLDRAYRLLITINVTVGEGTRVRHMMHVRGMSGYQTYKTVASNPDLAALKLQQLTEDIARARGRLRAFREVLPEQVSMEIDEALEKAEAKAAEAAAERTTEAVA